jgi:nitroimidazol reductase NimA-like FMN-containing flavoprotein (pyridoxamine 5'-phosphate oxidase superfamily)
MTIHEMNEPDCLALIDRAPFAHLGCAFLAQPYIVPIQLAFDAEARCLYGFSLAGQKIVWMRRNPKVCVAVDEIVDKDRWSSVLITGRYQ